MNFVTKKEFEDALAKLNQALQNKQILIGHTGTVVTEVKFSESGYSPTQYDICHLSFVNPYEAAHAKLIEVRKSLDAAGKESSKYKNFVDASKNEEEQLVKLLPTLKEK